MLKLNFTPFPVLETERLLLRAARLSDAKALAELRSQPRVNEFLDRNVNMTLQEAEQRIIKLAAETQRNNSIEWIIQFKDEDTMIGSICLWNIIPEEDKGEMGYEMHPDHYGKGIMTEAMQHVINYAFTIMQLKTIEALPHKDNIKSIQVLERNGFSRDFDLKKYKLSENEIANTAVFIRSAQ